VCIIEKTVKANLIAYLISSCDEVLVMYLKHGDNWLLCCWVDLNVNLVDILQ
jgi:hypothetical protein